MLLVLKEISAGKRISVIKNKFKGDDTIMNRDIDQEMYANNLFYRQIVDHLYKSEYEKEILMSQIELLRHETIGYANQMPYSLMSQESPYMWRAPYSAFENNYTNYWGNKYPMQKQLYESQCRRDFKNAVDAAAYITKDSCPVASIVFDSIGLMTANNLIDAIIKTMSIVDKSRKL